MEESKVFEKTMTSRQQKSMFKQQAILEGQPLASALEVRLERLRSDVVNAEGCDLPIGRWWLMIR